METTLKDRLVPSFRHGISYLTLLAVIGFAAYICAFPVADFDFWWHVKAGEIIFRTHHLIRLDPFAYTRTGQPFLPRYEWLSQVALYLVFHLLGPTGIILFRTGMVALVFVLLLSIDPASFWPNGFLAIWALNLAGYGYLERPQLFTYVLFSSSLLLAYRTLEWSENGGLSSSRRKRIACSFIALQVLWANFHGGACIMGLLIVGALWAQAVASRKEVKFFTTLAACVFVASFVSPNTYHNAVYVADLVRDRSTSLIQEWKPRIWTRYLDLYGLFWIMTLLCCGVGRRGRIFSLSLLVATGVMSLKARRNEELFVFTALGSMVFGLRHSPTYQRFLDRAFFQRILVVVVSGLLLWGLASHTHLRIITLLRGDHLFRTGYGTFEPARGAYDFIERENIQGHMFNSYDLGGYLIYRGYPNRPVFIDGRNVDYGYQFVSKALRASLHPRVWESLERRYQLTYAVIEYDGRQQLPYTDLLDANPHWKLVYLDDWAAVYLKDTPENLPLIRQYQYHLVTSHSLDDSRWMKSVRPEQEPLLETELNRVIMNRPDGVKGRLALARYYLHHKEWEKARPLVEEALRQEPLQNDFYNVLETIEEGEGRWKEAAGWYERVLNEIDPTQIVTNEIHIGYVFAKAGNPAAARKHWVRERNRLERVLRNNPSNSVALNNLGILYHELGNRRASIDSFKKAVAYNPRDAAAYLNLGNVLNEEGLTAEAWDCVLALRKLGANSEPLASDVRAKMRVH